MRNILRFSTLAFAAASFALVTMPASAADVISVPPFKAIALHGGGHVTIHHGNTQRDDDRGRPQCCEIQSR